MAHKIIKRLAFLWYLRESRLYGMIRSDQLWSSYKVALSASLMPQGHWSAVSEALHYLFFPLLSPFSMVTISL